MSYPELIEQAALRFKEQDWPEATPEEQVEADKIFKQMYVDCIGMLKEGQKVPASFIRHLMVGIDVEGVSSKVMVSITQIERPGPEKIQLVVNQLATTRGFLELRREQTDLIRMGINRYGDKGQLLRRANLEDARQFSAVVGFLQGFDLRMGSPLRLA